MALPPSGRAPERPRGLSRPAAQGVVLGILAWLPACALALAQERFVGSRGAFAEDAGFHVRMLVAVPLMWSMRGHLGRRIDVTVAYFADARLVERETVRLMELRAGAVVGRSRPRRAWLSALVLG